MANCCGGGSGLAYRLILSLDGTETDLGVQTQSIYRVFKRLGPRMSKGAQFGSYDVFTERSGTRERAGTFYVMDMESRFIEA